jgi:HEAT repeat protein
MTNTIDIIIEQLQSPDAHQRSKTVFELQPGTTDDARAVAALVRVIIADNDLNVIEDATWVLVRHGAAATTTLLNQMAQEDARARHNIVHALGKIGDAEAVPHLIRATQDSDPAVRLKVVYALGQIGDPRAIEALIARLDDPAQDVQWTAREVLEGFGEKALPNLLHALRAESIHVRELAASLLGDIGDSSAVQPLIAAAETDNWQVRFAVVEALGQIGDSRALPMVEGLLNDENPRLRAIATQVAKRLNRA